MKETRKINNVFIFSLELDNQRTVENDNPKRNPIKKMKRYVTIGK